jgi:hypothetical protein
MPSARVGQKGSYRPKRYDREVVSPGELDDRLDEALRDTFPASDPVSLTSQLSPGAPLHQEERRSGNERRSRTAKKQHRAAN